jgi:hypothetical protein
MLRSRRMNALLAALVFGPAVALATAGANAGKPDESSTTLTAAALAEIARVEAEIDRIEAHRVAA